jgi:hypothetical protein
MILPVVLYVWNLFYDIKGDRVLENRVLRGIFGPRNGKVSDRPSVTVLWTDGRTNSAASLSEKVIVEFSNENATVWIF